MIDPTVYAARVQSAFPFLQHAPLPVHDDLVREAMLVQVPAQHFIGMEGDACVHLALVLSGQARVYKSGESGREITLYRIRAGESCIMTASCILSQQAFPAFAITETEVEALLIPAGVLRGWMARHTTWQQYLFGLLADRLAAVISVVEDVTFRRMDARLATHLLAAPGNVLATTHEAIATELGTSREVVSRLLKRFEDEGFIHRTRGHITVADARALRKATLL